MPKRTLMSRKLGHNYAWVDVFNGHVVSIGEESLREGGVIWSSNFRNNYETLQKAMSSVARLFPDFYEEVRKAAPKDKLLPIKRVETIHAKKKLKKLTEEERVLTRTLEKVRKNIIRHKQINGL